MLDDKPAPNAIARALYDALIARWGCDETPILAELCDMLDVTDDEDLAAHWNSIADAAGKLRHECEGRAGIELDRPEVETLRNELACAKREISRLRAADPETRRRAAVSEIGREVEVTIRGHGACARVSGTTCFGHGPDARDALEDAVTRYSSHEWEAV